MYKNKIINQIRGKYKQTRKQTTKQIDIMNPNEPMVGNKFVLYMWSNSVLPVYESRLRSAGPKRHVQLRLNIFSTFSWTNVLDLTIRCDHCSSVSQLIFSPVITAQQSVSQYSALRPLQIFWIRWRIWRRHFRQNFGFLHHNLGRWLEIPILGNLTGESEHLTENSPPDSPLD